MALTALTTYLVILYAHSRWLMANPPHLAHADALKAAMPDAQSGLCTILVLCGLILVPFVVPPVRSRVRGGSPAIDGDAFSSAAVDWRPTAIAAVLLAVYGVIVPTPALRLFFDLAPLSPL